MSALIYNDITTQGLALLAKAQTGTEIVYTKIILGDGHLKEGQKPRDMTHVINGKVEMPVTKVVTTGAGTAVVGGVFNNDDLQQGFYYRELGLFALDPDEGEILYSYGNAGDNAEWIPPAGGPTVIEKKVDVIAIIGQATNVSAYVRTEIYATKEELDEVRDIADAAHGNADMAISIAQQAQQDASAAVATVTDLEVRVTNNTSKFNILWDALFSDITGNPFQITFEDLEGLTLASGVWNEAQARLEC